AQTGRSARTRGDEAWSGCAVRQSRAANASPLAVGMVRRRMAFLLEEVTDLGPARGSGHARVRLGVRTYNVAPAPRGPTRPFSGLFGGRSPLGNSRRATS